MRIFLSIKYHADQRNRTLVESLLSILAQQGHETICIARDVEEWGARHFTPRELMTRTCAEIETCDRVVVELTEKGVGLGIEAGYAFARGIPIIAIARSGADISATLAGISSKVFHYEDLELLRRFPFGGL